MSKLNHVQIVFDRTGLAALEDVAVCTMTVRSVTHFLPDDPYEMTNGDRDGWAAKFGTFWDAFKGNVATGVKLKEARFYEIPAVPGPMGDPVHIHSFGMVAGTSGSAMLPPQNSVSITWKTDERKTWGRFYLPGLTVTGLSGAGYLSTTVADALALAAKPLADRSGTGATLTVFSRKGWTHHDPQVVQVDNIVDIIRRRRWSAPTYRAQQTVG